MTKEQILQNKKARLRLQSRIQRILSVRAFYGNYAERFAIWRNRGGLRRPHSNAALCPCGGMEDAVGLEPIEEIHMGSSPILDTF